MGTLKTIVYYDCLDYPLTEEELEIFSFKNKEDGKADLTENIDGFYFLKGRSNLIQLRKERARIAKKKWDIALRAAKWLRIIPYIRLVFASGSLALDNTTKESDLDFLIVSKSGRIWTSRFFAVVLLGLLGIRRKRHQRTAPDKVCLNHFITDKSLSIPRKSIYTAQLYARLVPVFIKDPKLVGEFCEMNSWVGDYVTGWPDCIKRNQESGIRNYGQKPQNPNSRFIIHNSGFQNFLEFILNSKFGDWLESILKKYQLHRIKNYHLTYKSGGRVKADDESLEFHPDSPELKIIDKYNKKMIELGFEELAKEMDSGLTKATNYDI